jgi:dihydrodipicolinate synthase/N-acetylneuraminate lyase
MRSTPNRNPPEERGSSPRPQSDRAGRPLRGIVPPLVTPLREQDSLDTKALERLIAHTLSGGVSGLFLLGTTGEGPSLSYHLRAELVRRACALTAGRARTFVAISDTSFTESVRLAHLAAEAGADFLVAAPPFYLLASQDELLRYFECLHDAVPLPLFLYNIPVLTKVGLELPLVARAFELPRISGIKDSSGDLPYLEGLLRLAQNRPDLGVWVGSEQLLLEGLRRGAAGGVCGGANLAPSLFVSLFRAAESGDWPQAARIQQQVDRMNEALVATSDPPPGYIQSLKAALERSGICLRLPALPLAPLPGAILEKLSPVFARIEQAP